MSTTQNVGPKVRLYDDKGNIERGVLTYLDAPVHRLFAHWVHSHHLERDFMCALEHTCNMLLMHYLLEGSPDFVGEPLPEPVLLPAPAIVESDAPRVRLYDGQGNLAVSLDVLDVQRKVLAPLFMSWTMQNRIAREFGTAIQCVSASLYHGYSTRKSLGGGLGGGITAEQYLALPFASP